MQSVATDEGMQINRTNEQYRSAESPIDESGDPDSNAIVERERHPKKPFQGSVYTDEGMQIDESDEEFSNASSRITESCESNSIVKVRSEVQSEKQRWERV
jgi:hypothetical protein